MVRRTAAEEKGSQFARTNVWQQADVGEGIKQWSSEHCKQLRPTRAATGAIPMRLARVNDGDRAGCDGLLVSVGVSIPPAAVNHDGEHV